MIPILFSENSTTFTTNGVGRLSDAFSCNVVEERNGQYELQMSYPMTGQHYEDITIRSIIVVKPSANATLQAFRVYKVTKPINGKVTVFAQHISYDLSKNVSMPFSISPAASTACNATLQGLKTNAVETCPFTFWTDVTTVATYTQAAPASIRQRLGGVEGSVLDQFGGEYEWDNFTVKLHKNRGVEKDITLRYGKNITDLEQEENIANTVTGVVPFWINTDRSESVTLPEKAVYASNASAYSTHLTEPLDLSADFKEKPTVTQLRNRAQIYVNKTGFGLPKISIQVSFVNLADTEEYRDILPLQECSLCDTIKVQFERLGIDTTAKIVKTDYDVLREKYNSIEVGSVKSSLATTINDMNAATVAAIEATTERVYADVNLDVVDIVDNATAWLTSSGGYVMAVKNNDGSWKELLFMDSNNVQTAHNVLRINENGIGFSSNGVSGPYTQAWTLDGKLVIGGTNVPSITAYDSQGNIIFQASASAMIWNAANSSMDATGKITMSGATINNGVITIKDANNNTTFQVAANGNVTMNGATVNNGTIQIKDAQNNVIFQANASAMIWNAANSSMDATGKITMNGAQINNGAIVIKDAQNNVVFQAKADGTVSMTGATINNGTIQVKDAQNNVIFKVDASAMIWNTSNSSMDATGKITMNGAQINGGEINQINQISSSYGGWLNIKDGFIRGGATYIPTGETEPVIHETGFIQFWGLNYMGPTIHTDGRLFIEADTILTSNADGSVSGDGRTGSYVSDLTYRTLKDLLDTYLLITKDSDGYVTNISWLNGDQVNIATGADKRQLINGIATTDAAT